MEVTVVLTPNITFGEETFWTSIPLVVWSEKRDFVGLFNSSDSYRGLKPESWWSNCQRHTQLNLATDAVKKLLPTHKQLIVVVETENNDNDARKQLDSYQVIPREYNLERSPIYEITIAAPFIPLFPVPSAAIT